MTASESIEKGLGQRGGEREQTIMNVLMTEIRARPYASCCLGSAQRHPLAQHGNVFRNSKVGDARGE